MLSDAAYQAAWDRLEERNFTGYPGQWPPIALWAPYKGEPLAEAWAATRGSLQLYANFPYCKTRCTFCFLPVAVSDAPEELESYLDAFEREAEYWRGALGRRVFSSFYIGGGTPSLLRSDSLERFLTALSSRFSLVRQGQWAFEANPLFLDQAKARLLKDAGVNWLSLGVQTLNPAIVARTERSQTNESVFRAYAAARKAGIPGINVDLICGLEGQSEESFLFDVEAMAKLRPDQIHLNLFEGTRYTGFSRRGRRQGLEEIGRAQVLRRRGFKRLMAAGYVLIDDESAGLTTRSCNRQASIPSLLERRPLLGLGSGAVSYLPSAWRHVNHVNVSAYQRHSDGAQPPVMLAARLSRKDETRNFILNSLLFNRTGAGELDADLLERHFGRNDFDGALRGLVRGGALFETEHGWRLNAADPQAPFRVRRAVVGEWAYRASAA